MSRFLCVCFFSVDLERIRALSYSFANLKENILYIQPRINSNSDIDYWIIASFFLGDFRRGSVSSSYSTDIMGKFAIER